MEHSTGGITGPDINGNYYSVPAMPNGLTGGLTTGSGSSLTTSTGTGSILRAGPFIPTYTPEVDYSTPIYKAGSVVTYRHEGLIKMGKIALGVLAGNGWTYYMREIRMPDGKRVCQKDMYRDGVAERDVIEIIETDAQGLIKKL
jgi:hypothetical protein